MEKRRLVLVNALNFLCRDEGSVSQFAYQLGIFFITKISRNNLKLESIYWVYETLEELGDEFAIFLMREKVNNGQLLEALQRLKKIDFIAYETFPPTIDEVDSGVRDKLHKGILLPIELLCDFHHQINKQLSLINED